MKPILVAPLIAIVLAGVGVGTYLAVVGVGSGEEAPAVQATSTPTPTLAATPTIAPTPTPTPTPEPKATQSNAPGGKGGGEEGTLVPVDTSALSPPPVPSDWQTYTDPDGRFSFRFPPNWYDLTEWVGMPRVASWDQQSATGRDYPPGAIGVDVTVLPIDSGAAARPEGASDATLGGNAGWQFGYEFDPSLGPARNHVIVADHGEYRFMLIGWFADEKPDETTFLQIVSTFCFTK